MLSVALTGNVAAGKSSVVRWFARWGATIIDADAIARETQRPGTEVFAAIVQQFGNDVVGPDGKLDRATLRRRVLADEKLLTSLNAIVHPAVQRRRAKLISDALAHGVDIVVNDIPLLFEVLDPSEFDIVVLVDAPEQVRLERLLRRGLEPKEAERLIASQLPSGRKRALADIVIDNHGSLDDLRRAAKEAWKRIEGWPDSMPRRSECGR